MIDLLRYGIMLCVGELPATENGMPEIDDKTETTDQPTTSSPSVMIPPELVEVIRVGVRANHEVPGSVALGGAVCALFAQHRASIDIDFVLTDLKDRFQEVREHLFALPGWQEALFRVPVLILGSLDGIEVGYRQLRCSMPLETQEVETPDGTLLIPTLEELLRIKAFLAYERNYTRDFVDFAELSCLLELPQVVEALRPLDEKFQWEKQPSMILEITKTLLRPDPHDREIYGFETLRLLHPKLKTWDEVAAQCHEIGKRLSIRILGGSPDATPQP
jgi:hypothetical protein